MKQPFSFVLCSTFGLRALIGVALAVRRSTAPYTILIASQPLGDRNGHIICSLQYACRVADGQSKGEGITAIGQHMGSEKGDVLGSACVHRELEVSCA